MANPDAANGFVPVGTIDGSDYHGKLVRVCFLAGDSTATFIGDAVKVADTGSSADGDAISVVQAAAGDRAFGVLTSLEPDLTDESSLSAANYRRASTLRYGLVLPFDSGIFSIQEDSVGGNLAAADVNLNVDIATVGSGDTTTGLSAMELDSGSAATSNTVVYRLLGVDRKQGNAIGANCRWLVTGNLTNLNNTTGV